jgi:hypothetical protein
MATLSFDETVTAATPGGSGNAAYDPAATSALHDPDKLVFDLSPSAVPSSSQTTVTIIDPAADITDLAGNPADIAATEAPAAIGAPHFVVADSSHDFHLV